MSLSPVSQPGVYSITDNDLPPLCTNTGLLSPPPPSSMEGSVSKLDEVVAIKKKYKVSILLHTGAVVMSPAVAMSPAIIQ